MALNVGDAYQQGRELGRIVSTAQAHWEVANGVGMAAAGALAGPPTLAAAAACTAGTAGVCALPSGVVLTAEGAMVVAGAAEAAHGGGVLLYAKSHPVVNGGSSSPQFKKLTDYEIKLLKDNGYDVHQLKGGKNASKYDLYKRHYRE